MNTPPSPYETLLVSLGIDPSKLTVDEHGTLAPSLSPLRQRLSLPLLRTEADADGPADVRLNELIGQGGMGRVFAAEQVALGRDVAVKVLHDASEEAGTDALLREALIAGRLEHPNVVPVYLLGRSAADEPLFVMRRIAGVPWSTVLRDLSAAPGMFAGARDALEFHLEVFLEVCDAVQFAHSRGILHRDLKPDNVMLGAFREVYVVDWGIAVSLRDDPTLPLASESRQIAGTPGYMAPEMTAPEVGELSERTDVYLLGAVLHQVLTGTAPHAAPTLLLQLAHAYESPASVYDAAVPEEFAGVCRRAMARRPEQRFGSVDELRRAVQDCLRHRSSWALSAEADRRARALRDELARVDGGREGAAARIQGLFSECRFGYRQALAGWEDNRAASTGLQSALEAMIEYELARHNPRVAEDLLAQLPTASDELAAAVAAAVRDAEARASRLELLERFEREADVNRGAPLRGRLGAFAGMLWSVIAFVSGWLDRSGRIVYGYREAVVSAALFAVMSTALSRYMRRDASMNDAQGRFLTLVSRSAWGFIVHWLMCWGLGVRLRAAMALYLLWTAAGWGTTALLYDRRIRWGAAVLGAAAFGVALWPRAMFEIFGLAVLLAYALVLVAWNRRA